MKTKFLSVLLAGAVLLGACKGKYERGSAESDSVKTDSINMVAANQTPKIVKTAEIGFKVKSVQESSEKLTELTSQFGGTITHHQTNSTVNRSNDVRVSDDSVMRVSAINTNCEITARVPSEKLEEYIEKVSRMGIYVNLSRMDMEDKSLDYLSSQLKVNNRKEFISQQKKGKVVVKDPADVMLLKDDLVDQQISNRKIDDAVKYSVVNLNFYQSNTIVKEIVANDDPAVYNIGFFKRVGLAFGNGWYIFKEVVILLIDVWVFILAAAVIWMTTRVYRKRALLKTNI